MLQHHTLYGITFFGIQKLYSAAGQGCHIFTAGNITGFLDFSGQVFQCFLYLGDRRHNAYPVNSGNGCSFGNGLAVRYQEFLQLYLCRDGDGHRILFGKLAAADQLGTDASRGDSAGQDAGLGAV